MSDKFTTVATYNNNFEAQLAKNLLQNEGIESLIGGALASDVVFGGLAVADPIILQVQQQDAQRAAGILAAVEAARLDENWEEQAESGAGVWLCSICGEPVSNRLSMCYSCQTPRESIRTAIPHNRTAIQHEPSTLPAGEEVQRRDESVQIPPPVPSLTSPPAAPPIDEDAIEQSPTERGDDLAHKALIASVFTLFLPVLIPVAWIVLLRVVLFGNNWSPKGRRQLYIALFIDTAIGFLVLYFLAVGRLNFFL